MDETGRRLPACRTNDPDLWFAEGPADLERAKQLCVGCPVKAECLAGALARQEPWGVWGGEILDRGAIIARKRARGRPAGRTDTAPSPLRSTATVSATTITRTVTVAAGGVRPGPSGHERCAHAADAGPCQAR